MLRPFGAQTCFLKRYGHLTISRMLTEKQEAVLNFIRQFQQDEHVPPSTRIIKSRLGFKAQNSAVQFLATLASKGFVEKYADGRWGVKNVGVQIHLFELPVLGE